jgi:O-antigen/teichoic acid export membrane protein
MGTAGAKILTLLMLPFYTRWLSVEDFGAVDILSVYVRFLFLFITASITESIFIFPKNRPIEEQRSYFSSGLFFALIAFCLTAFLFKLLDNIFKKYGFTNVFADNIWLIYGLLVATFLQEYIQQFVRGMNKMVIYSTTGIVVVIGTILFSFFLIPRWKILGYALALILANISGGIYAFLSSGAFRYIAIKYIKKSSYTEMLKYSMPLLPNSLAWWFISGINRPLMEKYLGLYAIGIFVVANKFASILSTLFTVFTRAWQASVLEEYGKDGYERYYNKVFQWIMVGLIILFFIITVSSKVIVSLFTTNNYYEAWEYISPMTLGAIFSCISAFASAIFSAVRKSKYYFYSSIWGAIVAIISNIFLIRNMGIMGTVVSILLSNIIIALFAILYGWKYVHIKNISMYLIIFLICFITSFVNIYIQSDKLKYCLLLLLFSLFIFVNRGLKVDIIKMYKNIKLKFRIF